jgi:signal transduction histidine kinase
MTFGPVRARHGRGSAWDRVDISVHRFLDRATGSRHWFTLLMTVLAILLGSARGVQMVGVVVGHWDQVEVRAMVLPIAAVLLSSPVVVGVLHRRNIVRSRAFYWYETGLGVTVMLLTVIAMHRLGVEAGGDELAPIAQLVASDVSVLMASAATSMAAVVGGAAMLAVPTLLLLTTPEAVRQATPSVVQTVVFGFVFGMLFRGATHYIHQSTMRLAEAEAQLAAERERIRLYTSVHDGALQTLELLGGGWNVPPEMLRDEARHQAALLRSTIQTLVGPASTDAVGQLQHVADAFGHRGLIVTIEGMQQLNLDPATVQAVVGATTESLNNVIKHAGVDRCQISIVEEGSRVSVRIIDRGCGFDPGHSRHSVGLEHSIRRRISAVGGTTEIRSAPGAGTIVDLTVEKG